MGDDPVHGAARQGEASPQVGRGGASSSHGQRAQVIREPATQVRLEPRQEAQVCERVRLLVEQAGPLGERGLPLQAAPARISDRVDGGAKLEAVDRGSHVLRRHAKLASHPDHHAAVLAHRVKEERPLPLGEAAREAMVLEEPVQVGGAGRAPGPVRPAGCQVREDGDPVRAQAAEQAADLRPS